VPFTFDDIRAKYPRLTDEEVRQTVALLNRKPKTFREICESENVMSDTVPEVGPDGLTKPMRECNRFAEEHALPIPFPPERK
jgi:hypothetical protein